MLNDTDGEDGEDVVYGWVYWNYFNLIKQTITNEEFYFLSMDSLKHLEKWSTYNKLD